MRQTGNVLGPPCSAESIATAHVGHYGTEAIVGNM